MELSKLQNTFKEKTEITLASLSPEGELTEETVKIYHWDVLAHRVGRGTGEVEEEKTSLIRLLLDAEKDTDNPVPVVTRQLHLLGVYSKDLTDNGKPITDDLEVIAKIPIPVQSKIAREICAPALGVLQAITFARQEKEAGDDEERDEENAESPSRDSAED